MPIVKFSSSFHNALGHADPLEVEIEAQTIRELLRNLVAKYPKMQQHIDEGVAVSINGQIYRDLKSVTIPKDAEVFLIPRIAGG